MICSFKVLSLSLVLIIISACSSGGYVTHYYVRDSYVVGNLVYLSVYEVVDKLKWSNISHSTKTIVLSKKFQLYSLDIARADSRFVLLEEEKLTNEYNIQNVNFLIPSEFGIDKFKLYDFYRYVCVEGGAGFFDYNFSENRKYVRLACGENTAILELDASGSWSAIETSSTSNSDQIFLFDDGVHLTLPEVIQLAPLVQINGVREYQVLDVEKTAEGFHFLIKGFEYSDYKVIEPDGRAYDLPFLDEYGRLAAYYNWDVEGRRFFTRGTDEDLDLRKHDYGNFEVVKWTKSFTKE